MPPAAERPRSPLPVLFLAVFIDLMGFGIVIPLLPIYAERFGATVLQVGFLAAVYSLMQLLFAPIWGSVSDRVGRRPVLLASLAGSVLSYLLLGAAGSLTTLFVARALAGVAGANIPVAQAYIADVTSEVDRARGMGLIGAAFGLGMIFGPAIGGGLSIVSPRLPEWFAAGLCVINVVLAAWRLPESLARGPRKPRGFRHPFAPSAFRSALARPGAPVLLTLFFLVTLCFAILEGTFSLTAEKLYGYGDRDPRLGGLWVFMAVVAVVVQGGLIGRLSRRIAEARIVLLGAGFLAIGLAWLPFAGKITYLLGALALVVGGQGLASPALSSLISKAAKSGEQGRELGISQSLSSAARVVGPSAGCSIFYVLGPPASYLAAAVCAVCAGVLVFPLARRAERVLRPEYEASLHSS